MQKPQPKQLTDAINNRFIFDQTAVPAFAVVVSVIVPARNEAKNIIETLDALRLQTAVDGLPLNPQLYEVLLLANNCTDDTYQLAKKYQQEYPDFQLFVTEVSLPPEHANIGYVRRVLMDEAYRRLALNKDNKGIIASTDGDTRVDTNWITQIMNEINKGCDAVGGRILTDATACASRLYYLRDVTYRNLLAKAESFIDPEIHDRWPRHYQYFGANMAVTCEAYHQVGRLPQVTHLEDNAFHEALKLMDKMVRKSPAVVAYTSTRLAGRVDIGFSEQLRKWSEYEKSGQLQVVEPVEAMFIKFKCRHILRNCRNAFLEDNFYDTEQIKFVADALFIDQKWLNEALQNSNYFGQLWANVLLKLNNPDWISKHKLVDISLAIKQLRSFTNN